MRPQRPSGTEASGLRLPKRGTRTIIHRVMADLVKIVSLGGSVVAPDRVDVDFLRDFRALVASDLERSSGRRFVLVVGGGGPAREYQRAYREASLSPEDVVQDWIGVAATRLNAALLHGLFREYCREEVLTDPTSLSSFSGKVLVVAGWKPGFSTDYIAVLLAERLEAGSVINLSNVTHVYSSDPRLDPSAVALEKISWDDFRKISGDAWTPGKNLPFDPVATARAAELGLEVIVAAGKDLPNLRRILEGGLFRGTTIGPR